MTTTETTSVAQAIRKIHQESGIELPKSFGVVVKGDWQGKRNFRSLEKAATYVESLGNVHWDIVDGKTGCTVADRVHLMNWGY